MILIDTEDHIFIGRDYKDLTTQLLQRLDVRDDETLAYLAATCLGCDPLDVMIVRANS